MTTTWNPPTSPRSPEDLRPALTDPALDLRLRRDGFVTFPLIDDATVERLRTAYGDLHGWTGTGFEPDLLNPDSTYRDQVDQRISAELDALVCARFAGYTPFLRNFLCKWPGADSGLYLHQDWTYIDERQGGSTYVVWVALSDVTGHDGQLRVLRGSHLLERALRGTNLTGAWWDHTDVIEPRLQSVPVRRGDCVIMNNALLHASFPNHTDQPRLVAAVGMAPSGEPITYFRSAGPELAEKYDVDPAFYRWITPMGLHQDPPPKAPAEHISVPAPPMSADELANRLDAITRRGTLLERVRARLERPPRHQG